MKRTKMYIEPDQAKKKVDRYQYWNIKDDKGVFICSNEENNPDGRSFGELLDGIMADNVDAEVQVRYGANEQSSRSNPPMFIRVNDSIEWVEPEEETVTINGTPHKVDKNGNVNINLTSPERPQPEIKVESARVDTVREEMEIRLAGIQKENELQRDRMALDTDRRLAEQLNKFRELMLSDRENRLAIREQILEEKEKEFAEKELNNQDELKGYFRQVPKALGGLLKEFGLGESSKSLGEVEKPKPEPKPRKKVNFSIEQDTQAVEHEPEQSNDYQEEIERIEAEAVEKHQEADTQYQEEFKNQLEQEDNDLQDKPRD